MAIDESQAKRIVSQKFIRGDKSKEVHMSDLLKANSIVNGVRTVTTMPFDGWLFFIDDHPKADLTHPCRFILVNQADGSTKLINEAAPPINIDIHKILFPPEPTV